MDGKALNKSSNHLKSHEYMLGMDRSFLSVIPNTFATSSCVKLAAFRASFSFLAVNTDILKPPQIGNIFPVFQKWPKLGSEVFSINLS